MNPTPLAIKTVIVTMFDPEPQSRWPSELERWVAGVPLTERVAFPIGDRDLRLNRDKGVLAVVTGVGNTKAAATVVGLGFDPRFDLRRAYWVVAGIAGANPIRMSIGSACWIDWVVDGDLTHDIDPREMPPQWPTGRIPLGKSEPYQLPVSTMTAKLAYRLNPSLVDWAYRLTEDSPLGDTTALGILRERFTKYPEARRPPLVRKGALLASNSLWHGKLLNDWAECWVDYWTGGRGGFAMSAMEDAGIALALEALARTGRADANRLLILRAASNFTMPGDGVTAAASLADEMREGFSAYVPALDAAYRVASRAVDQLLGHWDQYSNEIPGGKE